MLLLLQMQILLFRLHCFHSRSAYMPSNCLQQEKIKIKNKILRIMNF